MEKDLPKEEFGWNQIWEKNKVPISLGLVGMILIGIGVFSVLLLGQKQSEIEILPAEEVAEEATFFVDLEGAVERPGIYELPADSRVNDVLVRAGGLSAEADREWVAKNLNLAQKLVDGAKIYIPLVGETTEGIEQSSGAVAGVTKKINVNTASASELDTLWGIGEVRAEAIIDNRPYQSVEELKSKKIIPSNVYERIEDEISVF